MSGKSFPPPRPPHLPPHPPPHPPTPKIITRSFVDNVVKRFKHLATCQLSCNLTTSSKCAIFDELQEKIRSIASRPAQKVTGKIQSRASRACRKLHVPTCVGQKFPPASPPPPPHLPPTPTFPPSPHLKNHHTVIRRQCCETFQSSCNVPSILQRANYLATSQHLLNAPSVTSYKRKFGA